MQNKFKLHVVGLTILFFYVINIALGQERPEIRDSIYSNVLQEKRMIEILLPNSYKAGSAEKYGVVYVLDGEWNKWLLPGSYDFAVSANFIPDNIFVRIPNIYSKKIDTRDRDLSPTQIKEYNPISGGADNFRSFLKNELIPYINKKYPSDGENTLVGGSLAGLFAVYTLLKDPGLFKSYIAVEPAMHWDNRYVNKLASETLEHLPNIENTTLWIAGRKGVEYNNMGIAALDSILQTKAPKGLIWKSAAYPNETHYSAQYKGYYDGFKFTYSGYLKEIDVRPINGILLKNEPFNALVMQNSSDSTSLRYTTDGSLPTRSSKRFNFFIPLASPCQLILKSFSNRNKYDKVVSGSFQEGEALAANSKPKRGKATGLQYAYYEGTWDKLPEFKKLKPVQAGSIKENFTIDENSKKTNSAYLIEGQLEIPVEGYYVFYIDSAEDSKVYVEDQLIINGNGKRPMANYPMYCL